MSVTFPNQSRSYDEAGNRIRFSGYDGMFEIRFFLEIDALAKAVKSKIVGERDCLSAFDSVRKVVLEAAAKAYAKGRDKTMCTITAADMA